MNINQFLQQTFLFGSFTDKEIQMIGTAATLKRFGKGENVFSEGTGADAFFIVVAGKVKIYKLSADGKEYTLHIHGPGEPVAEAAIFDQMVYPASCTSIEDSSLIRISRAGVLSLIGNHPELALKMMSGYSKRLRQFVAKIEELSLKDIKSRLAAYILENSTVEKGLTVCRLPYSKKELSSLLGTVPETLSRALAFLKQRGLIREESSSIVVLDPDKLRVLSE